MVVVYFSGLIYGATTDPCAAIMYCVEHTGNVFDTPLTSIHHHSTRRTSMYKSSQTYSISGNQHILNGARNTTIGQAAFNCAGRDQVYHNYYDANPLWDAIADVGASHNSEQQVERGRCLPGTREAVLRLIHKWRASEDQGLPVCWLSGTAGVGKSAIALTVAEECEKDGLVASFFFFRSDPRRNNPSSLILSITHGLVVTRPHLKTLVNRRIVADPRILKARLEDQYKELILGNLNHPPSLSDQKLPDLVIVDGLDECGDGAMQRRVLSIIFSTYQQPSQYPLRFLICSRPESWIKLAFRGFSEAQFTKHIKLDDSFRPQYDIELYLDQQFLEIRRDPRYSQVEFADPWPASRDVRLLVEKADGQFIYPSTVIKFVKADPPIPRKSHPSMILMNSISWYCVPTLTAINVYSPFSQGSSYFQNHLQDSLKLYLDSLLVQLLRHYVRCTRCLMSAIGNMTLGFTINPLLICSSIGHGQRSFV
ncbi:hypothetical protein E1B28_003072 [Marasmius oreades]|nr:uncharacterized protein E1B28_003072 [Marasmius oreades]KAG7085511.1 hypothetical protein E1B28_003072 [Marasmius oreades]